MEAPLLGCCRALSAPLVRGPAAGSLRPSSLLLWLLGPEILPALLLWFSD